MKKLLILSTLTLVSLLTFAQDDLLAKPDLDSDFRAFHNKNYVYEFSHLVSVLFLMSLLAMVILTLVKRALDQRVKNKLIEKGASEEIITRILPEVEQDNMAKSLKWACILAGLGLGLTLVSLFQPLGIHSLAMMAFSVAAGIFAYYYFSRKAGR